MAGRLIRVVCAMLEKDAGHYLITQRSARSTLPLLWEFPGGRVHEGEADAPALVRELKERLDVDAEVEDLVSVIHHEYPDYDVELKVFHCRLKDTAQALSHARINDHRWVTVEQMSEFQFPPADARTIAKLLELDS
jgi:8-oxo-dGTP diphosphatase